MTPTSPASRKTQNGFTLVELAISLMIIGLLIGGVLKGQELIGNARITQLMRQIKAYETAVTIFKTTYNALPGDIKNPSTRLPNCAASPCNATGDGNGQIGANIIVTGTLSVSDEHRGFWLHLANAGLISGINTGYTGTPNEWGNDFPASSAGGGFHITYWDQPAGTVTAGRTYSDRKGQYILLNSSPGSITAFPSSYFLKPGQAANMDRKLDDGDMLNGDYLGFGTTGCYDASINYTESNLEKTCSFSYKVSE